ncbi:MAG: hypothetical protein RBU37_09365 [Myxococcota bacterium]|nr:hypothetical protein [Myxococcota bacterium]
MTHVVVEAPAKLIVFGGYGLLIGAPGLAVPLRRKVRVELGPESSDTFCLEAIVNAQGSRVEGASRILVHALASFTPPLQARELAALGIQFDSSQVERDGHKLGLGGSAALMVAACEALAKACQRQSPSFEQVDRAHRALQGGLGSGIDVAVSWSRAPVVLRRFPSGSLWWRPSSLRLPAWRAYSLGGQLPTFVGLERARPLLAEPPPEWRRVAQLQELLWALMRLGALRPQLRLFAALEAALAQLGERLGIDIVCARHRALSQLAGAHALVSIPSGAGGGELSLVLGEPTAMPSWDEVASAAGYLEVARFDGEMAGAC